MFLDWNVLCRQIQAGLIYSYLSGHLNKSLVVRWHLGWQKIGMEGADWCHANICLCSRVLSTPRKKRHKFHNRIVRMWGKIRDENTTDVSMEGVPWDYIACPFLWLNRHDLQENVHGPLTCHTCVILALGTMHGHLDPYPTRSHSMMYLWK